ncbi:MAG: putative repair protein [Rickettsiaceae bacterium]|jgi:DNA repair protein RadA/Sms|nr:putative repair protein [Rickettsiaceae bacterium]
MSKVKRQYFCANCGAVHTKWSGQCFDCKEWDSITEEVVSKKSDDSNILIGKPLTLESLDSSMTEEPRYTTPIGELNRVLGGGLVVGSTILIGGDPGIGKSTLLLQLAATLSEHTLSCLYITGEESTSQVKMRAFRLGLAQYPLKIISATKVEDIITTMDTHKDTIKLVVIDSIQTMFSEDISSAPGTVSQVRATAHSLISYAKQNDIILLIVGHVTKEGELAGPKVLEHMVDTVLYFEGDRNHHFRILRSIKNRFGGINEIGVFEMRESGLVEVTNPSELFLMQRESNVSGTTVFAGIEGSRPVLVEIQALTAPSNMATPRRSVVGWDANRLSMLLAVLAVRYGLNLSSYEVYLSVAGGLRITEPAADLAVASCIISAALNRPLPEKTVFFGEVGLSGEVRKVSQAELRIKEAQKLGFTDVVCSLNEGLKGDSVQGIAHIKQLKGVL